MVLEDIALVDLNTKEIRGISQILSYYTSKGDLRHSFSLDTSYCFNNNNNKHSVMFKC